LRDDRHDRGKKRDAKSDAVHGSKTWGRFGPETLSWMDVRLDYFPVMKIAVGQLTENE
jgi:hypothetical protein